ncbi:outer membrane protein assembly factor BamE [Moraxella sp. Tifton1]|uniref:Outer membrane protein assembly factor BamE n=1 Tax=Moraxella oculi TaxID=2940516 RepID=A0ABW8U2T0_9GAMM|nr:outer membrane protein assembly factor BamE [Moraxella sp. Tifton1]MCL1623151.1 outer membrane protein assembly factor BamE [Moraxella sp. Tifton1]
MKKLLATTLLASITALSGCQVFRVYNIDLPQGTPIDAQMASELKVGMTANQVLYLVGSPAIRDTLNPNRWDYLYDYTAGTDGRRKGMKNIKNASQHMSVYFENGRVVRIEGRDSLPSKKQQ